MYIPKHLVVTVWSSIHVAHPNLEFCDIAHPVVWHDLTKTAKMIIVDPVTLFSDITLAFCSFGHAQCILGLVNWGHNGRVHLHLALLA